MTHNKREINLKTISEHLYPCFIEYGDENTIDAKGVAIKRMINSFCDIEPPDPINNPDFCPFLNVGSRYVYKLFTQKVPFTESRLKSILDASTPDGFKDYFNVLDDYRRDTLITWLEKRNLYEGNDKIASVCFQLLKCALENLTDDKNCADGITELAVEGGVDDAIAPADKACTDDIDSPDNDNCVNDIATLPDNTDSTATECRNSTNTGKQQSNEFQAFYTVSLAPLFSDKKNRISSLELARDLYRTMPSKTIKMEVCLNGEWTSFLVFRKNTIIFSAVEFELNRLERNGNFEGYTFIFNEMIKFIKMFPECDYAPSSFLLEDIYESFNSAEDFHLIAPEISCTFSLLEICKRNFQINDTKALADGIPSTKEICNMFACLNSADKSADLAIELNIQVLYRSELSNKNYVLFRNNTFNLNQFLSFAWRDRVWPIIDDLFGEVNSSFPGEIKLHCFNIYYKNLLVNGAGKE